jgi:hypothetical protein
MTSIQKLISGATLFLLAASARGDELLYFDNPSVVATLRSSGKVAAYYVGHSDLPYLFKPDGNIAVCEFLIYGKARRNGGFEVKAWEPSLVPAPDSRISRGAIYVENDEWVVQFDEVPNGCRSRKDGEQFLWLDGSYLLERNIPALYMEEQGLHVRVVRRIRGIGIRTVHTKNATVFSTSNPAKNSKPSFSVSLGGLVLSIRQTNEYSNIEYIVPSTGEKLSGWVRTENLKDPFRF